MHSGALTARGMTGCGRGLSRERPRRVDLLSGCVLAWIGMCGLVFGQASEPELETGPRFRQALTQPLSVAWEQVDLRTICGRIQSAGHVALLLDRRIDPSVPVDFQSRETPLLELTQALIVERDARVVPVG
ncbi:MAG: hypothetical protein ACKOJF_05910, partial [Planctomycetaceae bacterium]